jgi:hypothetical protein
MVIPDTAVNLRIRRRSGRLTDIGWAIGGAMAVIGRPRLHTPRSRPS